MSRVPLESVVLHIASLLAPYDELFFELQLGLVVTSRPNELFNPDGTVLGNADLQRFVQVITHLSCTTPTAPADCGEKQPSPSFA